MVVARARHALYQELFTSCHPDKKAAIRLADMHVAIAQAFVEVERPKRVCSKDPAGFQVVGMLALRCMMGFRGLWPRELRRYPSCAAGWSGTVSLHLSYCGSSSLTPGCCFRFGTKASGARLMSRS